MIALSCTPDMDNGPSRRTILQVLGVGTVGFLSGCADVLDAGDDETDADGETDTRLNQLSEQREFDVDIPNAVDLETVVDGLEMPTDIAFVPDSDVRYVVTRPGVIHVHDDEGLAEEPLLDYTGTVELGGERGMLGLALHPEFTDTRRLFVRYSTALHDDIPEEYNHTFVLSEFEVGADLRTVDPDTERIVLEIPQPHENHNAGDITFGPDGYLYVTTGDGGAAKDLAPGHPNDWYEENEGGNGQDTSEFLLGGILRLDVDDIGAEEGYGIPPENPLVDEAGHHDEYYAWGLRNPWRLSFDGDDLYVGDVGQAQWEWVNLVERGGNYGWNVREGSHCFDASDRYNTPETCPDETPEDVRGGETLVDPVIEYPNNRNQYLDTDEFETGIAVIGGYVYRGSAIPELDGLYIFGDMAVDGRLFVAVPDTDGTNVPWPMAPLSLSAEASDTFGELIGFGRDEEGELYVLGDGGVYRLTPTS